MWWVVSCSLFSRWTLILSERPFFFDSCMMWCVMIRFTSWLIFSDCCSPGIWIFGKLSNRLRNSDTICLYGRLVRRYFNLPWLNLSPWHWPFTFCIRSANSDWAHSSSALRTMITGLAWGYCTAFRRISYSNLVELIKPSPFLRNGGSVCSIREGL